MIRISIFLLFLVGAINNSRAQIEIIKDFNLGEHNVGFRHEKVIDFSRSYGEGFRPIHLYIWYPSEEKTTRPLNYTDYFFISDKKPKSSIQDQERKNDYLDSLILEEIKDKNIYGKTEDIISNYKNLITISRSETSISNASFPLLVFAPGGNTSGFFHSSICEYLASHGYIVVSLPSLGNSQDQKWPFDQTGLNMQLDDMSFAINHLSNTIDQLNVEKIGLISWSVGGVAQAIYCMKNSRIGLFVSLDSGIGRTYGIEMIKESPYFNYANIEIPYLHFTGQQPEQYNVERSSEFYDSISSPVKHSLLIEPFAHQHFASHIGLIPALVSENNTSSISKAYANMCHFTEVFIDAYLKESIDSKNLWLELTKE